MKKMLWSVAIVFGLIFGFYFVKKGLFAYFVANYKAPAVTISATKAVETSWQPYISSVGTLTAVNGTDISAEVSGIVTQINFVSGQQVEKGSALILLNASIEQTQLERDQAKLTLAQINFNRYKTLLNKKAITQAEYDTAAAQYDQARADVAATQARIQQKTILAPFNGKIGIKQINLGQFVSAGTTMVTLQALDPLLVQFNVPERYLLDLQIGQSVQVNIQSKVIDGVITAINSKVDPKTRNILIEATLPNKDQRLYPGMFAQIKVLLPANNKVITLPQTAITYSLHGDSVFVIQKNSTVKRQYVKVGERRGNEVAILEGLAANDEVVTAGQLKLDNDTQVIVDNSVEL